MVVMVLLWILVVFRLNGSEAMENRELFVTGEATPFYLASRNACVNIRKLVSSGYKLCTWYFIITPTPSALHIPSCVSKCRPACPRAICVP